MTGTNQQDKNKEKIAVKLSKTTQNNFRNTNHRIFPVNSVAKKHFQATSRMKKRKE